MTNAGSLTYVYCVADAKKLRAAKTAPAGLPKSKKPRLLDLGEGLALVVADVPASEYASGKIDPRLKDLQWVSKCAIGHEKVVEHFAGKTTVIPMKLFTLFSSDERASKDVGKKRRAIERTLHKLEGREEWGVRLSFNDLRALEHASKVAQSVQATTGRGFLERKKGERDVKKQLQTRAAHDATQLYETLALASEDARRRPAPVAPGGPRVLLDAAFLIGKKKSRSFKANVDREAGRLRELGYDIELTGPWPPYNFVGEGS